MDLISRFSFHVAYNESSCHESSLFQDASLNDLITLQLIRILLSLYSWKETNVSQLSKNVKNERTITMEWFYEVNPT